MFKANKSTLSRWIQFNTVGAMGFAIQLGSLALLLHIIEPHFLWASVLAVEISVVHNFLWHWKWTWADRRRSSVRGMIDALFRFNLSNGVISIAGTLFCTGVLIDIAHVGPILANAISLLPCCVLNFLVSDRLIFFQPNGETA
jgi:putative flippase GtrA